MFICIYPSKILSRILFRVCVCVFTYSTIRFHSYKLLSISTEHAHCTTIYGNRFFIDKLVQTLYTMTTKPAQHAAAAIEWANRIAHIQRQHKKKTFQFNRFSDSLFRYVCTNFPMAATITTNKRLKKMPWRTHHNYLLCSENVQLFRNTRIGVVARSGEERMETCKS